MPKKPADLKPKYQAAATEAQVVLDDLFPQIKAMQDSYFADEVLAKRYPRYLQLLWSHKTAPNHGGAGKDPDNTASVPQDRKRKEPDGVDAEGNVVWKEVDEKGWADTSIVPPKKCRVYVSDYDGPKGKGWVMRMELKVTGITVYATKGWGPGWYEEEGVDAVEEVTP